MQKTNLPTPDPVSLEHSNKVKSYIMAQIKAKSNKKISFADFMNLTLYAKGLGYYVAGKKKLGKDGDFVTAPEISCLFSQCIANQCAQLIQQLKTADVLEFGAGSGIMAADVLLHLEALDLLPNHYYILEVSPDLQAQQKITLEQHCPHLLAKVSWLNELPKPGFKGVILANEVLDAMPIHRLLLKDNKLQEYYVGVKDDTFIWELDKLGNKALETMAMEIKNDYLQKQNNYQIELCTMLKPWLNSLNAILDQGIILLIDYGFCGHEFFHPERSMGTLMCHFHHHAHSNPLIFPGIQDITAHIDFTQVAKYAYEAGLELCGFNSQAEFLIHCGLMDLLTKIDDQVDRLKYNEQVKLLTMPQEMGELFKVIAFSRKIDIPLLGFGHKDRMHQL